MGIFKLHNCVTTFSAVASDSRHPLWPSIFWKLSSNYKDKAAVGTHRSFWWNPWQCPRRREEGWRSNKNTFEGEHRVPLSCTCNRARTRLPDILFRQRLGCLSHKRLPPTSVARWRPALDRQPRGWRSRPETTSERRPRSKTSCQSRQLRRRWS